MLVKIVLDYSWVLSAEVCVTCVGGMRTEEFSAMPKEFVHFGLKMFISESYFWQLCVFWGLRPSLSDLLVKNSLFWNYFCCLSFIEWTNLENFCFPWIPGADFVFSSSERRSKLFDISSILSRIEFS